jgi:choline-phosphate cytidylyltransferase
MTRSRSTNRDSRQGSDDSDEDSDEKSPRRGRTGQLDNKTEKEVDEQLEALAAEDSKRSGM